MTFPPTRSAGLQRLSDFVPLAAKYAGQRNFDFGDERPSSVSRLSPYIRTRLITEEEATRAVMERHGLQAAGKFLQEVAWRTYWKGWLEMRPGCWDHYRRTLAELTGDRDYHQAISGNTGIECFDHWSRELLETGYLHNHARMWFASIWIFTLKLPWQIGADFFLRNLVDGDPAANTLSWRWVAGLHTPGKHYLARASNIEKFTLGRFHPAGQLDESARPLAPDAPFELVPLTLPRNVRPDGRCGHLVFPDDLAPPPAECGDVHATAGFIPLEMEASPLVTRFLEGAMDDCLTRRQGSRLRGVFSSALVDWMLCEKLDSILISRPTVGPVRDFLMRQELPAEACTFIRNWDRRLWPHATAGFFKLKKFLPRIHAALMNRNDDFFPNI